MKWLWASKQVRRLCQYCSIGITLLAIFMHPYLEMSTLRITMHTPSDRWISVMALDTQAVRQYSIATDVLMWTSYQCETILGQLIDFFTSLCTYNNMIHICLLTWWAITDYFATCSSLNPLKCSGIRQLHLQLHPGLSARVPECQILKM